MYKIYVIRLKKILNRYHRTNETIKKSYNYKTTYCFEYKSIKMNIEN